LPHYLDLIFLFSPLSSRTCRCWLRTHGSHSLLGRLMPQIRQYLPTLRSVNSTFSPILANDSGPSLISFSYFCSHQRKLDGPASADPDTTRRRSCPDLFFISCLCAPRTSFQVCFEYDTLICINTSDGTFTNSLPVPSFRQMSHSPASEARFMLFTRFGLYSRRFNLMNQPSYLIAGDSLQRVSCTFKIPEPRRSQMFFGPFCFVLRRMRPLQLMRRSRDFLFLLYYMR